MKTWLIKFLKDIGAACDIVLFFALMGIGLTVGYLFVMVLVRILVGNN